MLYKRDYYTLILEKVHTVGGGYGKYFHAARGVKGQRLANFG